MTTSRSRVFCFCAAAAVHTVGTHTHSLWHMWSLSYAVAVAVKHAHMLLVLLLEPLRRELFLSCRRLATVVPRVDAVLADRGVKVLLLLPRFDVDGFVLGSDGSGLRRCRRCCPSN